MCSYDERCSIKGKWSKTIISCAFILFQNNNFWTKLANGNIALWEKDAFLVCLEVRSFDVNLLASRFCLINATKMYANECCMQWCILMEPNLPLWVNKPSLHQKILKTKPFYRSCWRCRNFIIIIFINTWNYNNNNIYIYIRLSIAPQVRTWSNQMMSIIE